MCNSSFCGVLIDGMLKASFDKTLTTSSFAFILLVVIGTAMALTLLYRTKKLPWRHFGMMFLGVLIFEMFTAPLWNNAHLGSFGYLYRDVSWILTLGWTSLILLVVLGVDFFAKKLKEYQRFFLYLLFVLLIAIPFEALLVFIGVRSYAPEVESIIRNSFISGTSIPLQIFYYIPVFSALVIGFYKYWMLHYTDQPLIPLKKEKLGRTLVLTVLAVILFEVLVDPMVVNKGFPEWSYIYRDMSIILTGAWIVAIWIVTSLVDSFFKHLDLVKRFSLYLVFGSLLTWPVESLLIKEGFRVYGPSATDNFSGFVTPLTGVPVEIAFAIPFYLTLMICFVRYWQITLDSNK